MVVNDSKKSQKVAKNLMCKSCDYFTSRKCDYLKHLLTDKHKNNENDSKMVVNDSKKSQKVALFTCECGKKYKYDSGYYRHKKNCHTSIICIESDKNLTDKDLIIMLIKQNNDMMELLKNGTNNNIACNNNNTNINNSNNKTFNLQFFLNETCKDAMNITDFVKSIQPQLSDLIRVGEEGYVEGISNIIISNLKTLDITKRPIHCTDKKREVLYVKDEDKWEKEDSSKMKLRYMIKQVAHKNSGLISLFREKHPDCNKSHSKFANQYNKLVVESMGGFGDNDTEKEDKIINNIAKNVTVDKCGL